jgi:outer membrane protein TolC
LALTLVPAADSFGQTPLTLGEAMRRARTTTPAARALASASDEAAARIRQARAGYLPRIDVTESAQRSNHPVFVFGALLSQQRFTAAHFAIDALNRPAPVTNVRTGVSVEQPIFDAGLTRLAVESAELGRDLVASNRMNAEQDLVLGAARAFLRVVQLESAVRASQAAVDAAESDLERARARRDVGLVTDADVLDVEVHLADMRDRQLATTTDLAVAGIQLNEAMGAPLDEVHVLVPPDAPPASPPADVLIREAQASRADRREADLRILIAANARRSAQAAFLPRVGVQGGWEFNGRTLTDQRSSWIIGAQVQLNVFGGFGDAARVAGARSAEARTQAERDGVERAIEVDVRAALARLDAARGRQRLGEAALAQARESQRILRDRYDSGLAAIGDVLRAASAVLDAEARSTAARMDAIGQAIALDRAVGRL